MRKISLVLALFILMKVALGETRNDIDISNINATTGSKTVSNLTIVWNSDSTFDSMQPGKGYWFKVNG